MKEKHVEVDKNFHTTTDWIFMQQKVSNSYQIVQQATKISFLSLWTFFTNVPFHQFVPYSSSLPILQASVHSVNFIRNEMRSLLICLIFVHVNCEIFSSVDQLTDLQLNQSLLIGELEKFVVNLEDNVEAIKKWFWKYFWTFSLI